MRGNTGIIRAVIVSAALLAFSGLAHALTMSNATYIVHQSVISAGGGSSSSASFNLHALIGQSSALGNSSNTSYTLASGFLAANGVVADSDGDGVINAQDAFPNDPAASLDTDGDGYPDSWNTNATAAQITASTLILDTFPNDPVRWVDTIIPVITMNAASSTVVQGKIYSDAGATAWDNVDGDLTANITIQNLVNTSVIGTYTVAYNVSDAAGNAAVQVTRSINVVADLPPTIHLIGATPITIVQGAVYNDSAATAVDDVDGDVTARIITTIQVDTAVVATYTVSYNVSDLAGQAALQVMRIVNVIPAGGAANRGEAVQVPLTGSAASVEIISAGEVLSNFSAVGTSGTPPAGVNIPFGVLSYSSTVPVGSTTQTVSLSFSNALPVGFVLYKVDDTGIYSLIPNGNGADQWTQLDATTIALTLTDGGQFDLDSIINGTVIDPIAVGVPPTTISTPAPVQGGGSGCSISPDKSLDPVLLALILFSIISLAPIRAFAQRWGFVA